MAPHWCQCWVSFRVRPCPAKVSCEFVSVNLSGGLAGPGSKRKKIYEKNTLTKTVASRLMPAAVRVCVQGSRGSTARSTSTSARRRRARTEAFALTISTVINVPAKTRVSQKLASDGRALQPGCVYLIARLSISSALNCRGRALWHEARGWRQFFAMQFITFPHLYPDA